MVVALVGKPLDESWPDVISRAEARLAAFREEGLRIGAFDQNDLNHRRGNFLAVAAGVSFGGGQTVRTVFYSLSPTPDVHFVWKKPGNLVHSKHLQSLIDQVLKDKDIQRIAGFQSSRPPSVQRDLADYLIGAFALFAPKLYQFLANKLSALFAWNRGLRHNFKSSIFPVITLNCGPNTSTLDHADHGNAAGMYCAITSLGLFNSKKSAHIVVERAKIAVEFPPGSTVLVPSATLPHGNTPLQPGESRMSITQYCAGGLIRWVDYGFKSAKTLMGEPGGAARKAELDGPLGSRWVWALGMFSKASELAADRLSVFGLK